MKYFIAGILSFVLTSCMHPIMQDHHNMQEVFPEPTLQKEVTNGDVKAVATFPPMEYGKEVIFTVQLSDARTSQPLTDAKVFVQVEYLHQPDQNDRGPDTSHNHRAKGEHDINWNGEMEETNEQGVYAFSYKCYQSGEHMIVVDVTAMGDQNLDSPIVISAKRIVHTESSHQSGGMMGMGGGTTTVVIVGAALMGAMMVALLLAGGRMF